jgi:hypothetical protein
LSTYFGADTAKGRRQCREYVNHSIEGEIERRGVRSLKLTKCQFIPGFGEIVSSIYDLILVWFSDALGFG